MRKRTAVATGAIATAAVAVAVLTYLMVGTGGGFAHSDTRLDASDNVVPPYDWRKGYARTGAVCYTRDATRTRCFDADVLPYTTDATDTGWALELTQTNRMPTNVSGACSTAPWVCTTATMDSTSADPAGGTTASSITMGGGNVQLAAFGYERDTALDLRMWVKCSSGTLDASHVLGAGSVGKWAVNCTTVGGAWALLHSAHAAVTEAEPWISQNDGTVDLRLSGTDATIWHLTATEVASTWHHNTIPTTDATGSTVGTAAWLVDNSSGVYYAASGVTKVEILSQYSGTCWSYSGTTIKLSGASGCTATWYALGLTWSY